MTQTYLDKPATGDEWPDRGWALTASLVISATWILFSLAAWIWANGQHVDYGDLGIGQVMGSSGFGYVGLYLAAMFAFGVASVWLALIGARSTAGKPFVAVIAGAMAMFLVMVPFTFSVDHAVSHWCVGCAGDYAD